MGWRSAARIKELTRINTCLNFLEELRPRDKLCRQTKLSVKCRKRFRCPPRRITNHLNVVRMARSSRTLMRSPEWRHRHPVTSRQRHNLAGTLDRKRWNFTCGSLTAVTMRSSPFMDTRPSSFNSKGFSRDSTRVLFDMRGGLKRIPCNVPLRQA